MKFSLNYKPIDKFAILHKVWGERRAPVPEIYLITGYGSGKTRALIMDAIIAIMKNPPRSTVLFTEPTYSMVRRIALRSFQDVLDPLIAKGKIKINLTSPPTIRFPNGSEIHLLSRDNEVGLTGANVCAVYLDEITLDKTMAQLNRLRARVRDPRAKYYKIAGAGTPEGFMWFYDAYIKNKQKNIKIIQASSFDNPHLPLSFYENLRQSYTKELLRSYVLGEFVDLSGKGAFSGLSEDNIIDIDYDPSLQIIISHDWNVNPMTATLYHHIEGILYCFDEIYLENSSVEDIVDYITDKYKNHRADWLITGDSTGRARSHIDNRSAIGVLVSGMQAFYGHDRIDFKFKKQGESHKHSVLNTNIRLKHKQLMFSPTVEKTLDSLRKTKWADNYLKLNKDGSEHLSDTVRYAVDMIMPARADDFYHLKRKTLKMEYDDGV